MMEYSWNIDYSDLILDLNGVFIHCDVCNVTVKTRTSKPFTFSRWNELLVCKNHLVKFSYESHQSCNTVENREE